ncbi:MAG: metallophosphoesterase [Bacteroidales bacterium]|nr:metallophosphoesterase [Bacteroidales bacterium]
MLKIQYCSDLHLEINLNSFFLKQNPIIPGADILILAGDISYLRDDFYKNPFFDFVSQNWKIVFWVPGNHEFYIGVDMNTYNFSEPIKIRKNVLLINNYTIDVNDISFIFSTLWSKINDVNSEYIEKSVSDFYRIMINGKKLTAKTFNKLHNESFSFLKNECQRLKDKTKVIVTHHLPANQCNAVEFLGSKLNSAFCTELTDFVQKCQAEY